MSVIKFEQDDCRRARTHLDSYLKGEETGEAGREAARHLESCRECAGEVEARRRLKTALQEAVRRDAAPPALRYRIQREIRRQRPESAFLGVPWQRWALAAAMLVIAFGGWGVFRATRPAGPDAAGLAVTAGDLNVLNVGLGNHMHCAVERGLARRRFTDEEMRVRLGGAFAGLVPLVREKVGDDFTVVVGHTCRFQGREFAHLILRRDDDVVSLTVTKKQGEAFSGGMPGALAADGAPLPAARMEDYEVTGFETRDYLAFVVSNLPKQENELVASAVAPALRDFLVEREA